jgi:hypothetical protein
MRETKEPCGQGNPQMKVATIGTLTAAMFAVVALGSYPLVRDMRHNAGVTYCIDHTNPGACQKGWTAGTETADTEPPEEFDVKIKLLGGKTRGGEDHHCRVGYAQPDRTFLTVVAADPTREYPVRAYFFPDEEPAKLPLWVKHCGPLPVAG